MDPSLLTLLGEWQSAQDAGAPKTPEELCPDDAAMRAQLADAVRKLERGNRFRTAEPVEGLPTLPGYTLHEVLGQGGMGVIVRATEQKFGRPVAVKFLNAAGTPGGSAARRFFDEARITALLQHPGIPAVYDLGTTPAGLPYLAMKLIGGSSLLDLIVAGEPIDVSAVFESICQAVGYAHANGVIHRDLKPANVMVGAFGEVQVMDWGVAKVLANPETAAADEDPESPSEKKPGRVRTVPGSYLGTFPYMPPEQARRDWANVGPPSDVFGLGATLCHLLTKQPPYADENTELMEQARDAMLEPAYARLALCRDRELAALATHCLAEDINDRPADAGAVADEIAKIRKSAAERARQAELDAAKAVVQLTESVKRRSLGRRAAVLVAAALVVGLVASLWQMTIARRERDAKATALAAEEQARQQAFAALRSMSSGVIEKKFAAGVILTEEDKTFLRSVVAQYEAFAAIGGESADSQAIRAEGRFRIGLIRHRLGEMKEAEEDINTAVEIWKQLQVEHPTRPEFRYELAASLNKRGLLYRDTSRPKDAEADYTAAVAIQTQLMDEFPSHFAYRQELATSLLNRGLLRHEEDRIPEAESDYNNAVKINERLVAEDPARSAFRQDLAACHNNRANLLHDLGRPLEAEADYRAGLALYLQLIAETPTNPEFRQELALCHSNLGILIRAAGPGRQKEAEEHYIAAMLLRKKLVADYPARPEYRQEMAQSHNNRGIYLINAGRPKEAEGELDAAVTLYRQLAADIPDRSEFRKVLAEACSNRGNFRRDFGQAKEAEADYQEALDLQTRLAADFPDQPDIRNGLAMTCVNFAVLNRNGNDLPRAKKRLLEGRPHLFAALESNSKNPMYRRSYGVYLILLALVHAGLRETDDVIRVTGTRRDVGWDPPADAYNAACTLGQCILIANKLENLTDEQRREVVTRYSDTAIKMLRHAVDKGWNDVMHISKNADFESLREREDFKKLLIDAGKRK